MIVNTNISLCCVITVTLFIDAFIQGEHIEYMQGGLFLSNSGSLPETWELEVPAQDFSCDLLD